MTYLKIDIDAEAREFINNRPMKAAPEVLLCLLASRHWAACKAK